MIPLLVRDMLPEEKSMVLSDWKKDLWESKPLWGLALHSAEWWALVNHVIDRFTLPSSHVRMACHRSEVSVPLAWVANRDNAVLHTHATRSVLAEPDLAAFIERTLLDGQERAQLNPFLELKRPCPSLHSIA